MLTLKTFYRILQCYQSKLLIIYKVNIQFIILKHWRCEFMELIWKTPKITESMQNGRKFGITCNDHSTTFFKISKMSKNLEKIADFAIFV